MKITTTEELTSKQILDFINYTKTSDSGSDHEAQNTMKLIKEVATYDNPVTERLSEITALAAFGSLLHDRNPGVACWILGFMMGLKFANKELVDAQLKELSDDNS